MNSEYRVYVNCLDKIFDVVSINFKEERVYFDHKGIETGVKFIECIRMKRIGLEDKNKAELYQDDIVRIRLPSRYYQDHYGDNMPCPDGHYREPLEPYIREIVSPIVYYKDRFTIQREVDNNSFGHIVPLSWIYHEKIDKEQMLGGFRVQDSDLKWDDPEEGELQYLLKKYKLKSEKELIEYISGIEKIGNIHESPELWEDKK